MNAPSVHPADLPSLAFQWTTGPEVEEVLAREWLVTNGLGGYASGTLIGCNTRRYHALFVPCLPGPHGRMVMLPRLSERLWVKDEEFRLDAEEHADGSLHTPNQPLMRRFELRGLLPIWEFSLGETLIRRRLVLVHGENTLFVHYQNHGAVEARIQLRPFCTFRSHDRPIATSNLAPVVRIQEERVEITPAESSVPLRFRLHSELPVSFVNVYESTAPLRYRVEEHRGLDSTETQTSPGYFESAIPPGRSISLGATTLDWETLDRDPASAFEIEEERERRLLRRAPPGARSGTEDRLVLACDQFIIDPVTRPADEAWARIGGREARSVIAGYPWFTDWGRDTMVSLEGLALCTDRPREAAAILRTFCHHVRDGLLPNLFPEGSREGLYHTADATLWFFHAVDRYLFHTQDESLLTDLFPTLSEIIDRHLRGTRFGIGVDPKDGLLRQGAEGYPLTWMDAKVDDWVVTPRRGKAVEINALWFNALQLIADWAAKLNQPAGRYLETAKLAQQSFNQRFWNLAEGCLYDVVDGERGDDPAVRPNQIFAISLRHPVLRRDLWGAVMDKVSSDLLTPVGLRSLSPSHPDYRARYDGDLRARDAAYHQGTVWAWLLGHFADAWLRTYPGTRPARPLLEGLERHLQSAGVGQIGEIFDAAEAYSPRGCIAQAWSVAELLRAWLKTERA